MLLRRVHLPLIALGLPGCVWISADQSERRLGDLDQDGVAAADGDCDDTNPDVAPNLAETCGNHVDDDCDHGSGACGELAGDVADADVLGLAPSGSGVRMGATLAVGDVDPDVAGPELWFGAPDANGGAGGVYAVHTDGLRDAETLDGFVWGQIAGVSGDCLGGAIATLPSWAGGPERVAVGSPCADDGARVDAGAVYVYAAASGQLGSEPLATLTGSAAAVGLGTAVLGLPDVTGDGQPELVASSPDGAGSTSVGLWSGGSLGGSPAVSIVSGQAANVGDALAAGDLDGDGLPDLAIGGSKTSALDGAVWVVAGEDLSGDVDLSTDAVELAGATRSLLGTALAVCDVDGDGLDDLVAGAPGQNGSSGAAVVVLGFPADGLTAAGAIDLVPEVSQKGVLFGGAVACGGDFDGDGRADVVVGAPGWDEAGLDSGAAFLYETLGELTPGVASDTSVAEGKVLGTKASDNAGVAVLTMPDLDGDGYGELGVGIPGRNGGDGGGALFFGRGI